MSNISVFLMQLRGRRTTFALITKARKFHLSVHVQLELFDPVVLLGGEIWCCEGCVILGQIYLKFCKIILCKKTITCNVMG